MNKISNGGIRLPKNVLTILAICGILVGWGISYATLKIDISYLKKDLAKIEKKYNTLEATRLEWVETIHKIELHLERIDTKQEAIQKKLGL
jgi:hypothetical protein